MFKDCDLQSGRVWVVAAGCASTEVCCRDNHVRVHNSPLFICPWQPLHNFLEGLHESIVPLSGKEDTAYMQSFLNFIEDQ